MNETQENKQITEPGREEFEKQIFLVSEHQTTDLYSILWVTHFKTTDRAWKMSGIFSKCHI